LTPSHKSLLVIGLLTFVAGIVLLLPARVVYQLSASDDIVLGGIEGSIWAGSAREMTGGGLYLRDVRWRMRPLRLFTGKLGFDIAATPGSGFIEAEIALAPGSSISMSNLIGSGSLRVFAGILRMPGLTGNVSVQFERLHLRDGESGVIASVEDTNGVFDLAGSLTISADRSYVFLGKVAANERTSEKLRKQLRFLGSPDDRGQHEIRLEGSL
jgi:hypothetical protein